MENNTTTKMVMSYCKLKKAPIPFPFGPISVKMLDQILEKTYWISDPVTNGKIGFGFGKNYIFLEPEMFPRDLTVCFFC